MSIIAGARAAMAGINLAQIAMRMGLMALVVLLAFKWGQNDKRADHAEKEAAITKEYATSISGAKDAAFERGRQAIIKENENEKELDQIVREAEGLADPDVVCIGADTVTRLQQLQ